VFLDELRPENMVSAAAVGGLRLGAVNPVSLEEGDANILFFICLG